MNLERTTQPMTDAVIERPNLKDDKRFITVVYDCSLLDEAETQRLSDDLIYQLKDKKVVFAGVGYLVDEAE